jgi:DNA segregation ATPase FtsK/SpoIIIE, S-DNA-T family
MGLAMVDDTTRYRRDWLTQRALPPVVRLPQARFWPAPNGIRAVMGTVPGVGIEQVTKMAPHLANVWGCVRVDVAQVGPGQLQLRGWLSDPLGCAWNVSPNGEALLDWMLHVGIDDEGRQVHVPLSNLSELTVAGIPGTGKTSLQRWWLAQLAPHPGVQMAVLDGKVSEPGDGDYGQVLGRCFAASGDDLKEANSVLEGLWKSMRDRSAWLREHRGSAQFWEHGPTPDCPLVLVVVDESLTFVTASLRPTKSGATVTSGI